MTEISIDIRYPDCDPMGVVHHAVYPVWYEIARMDFFAKNGFPWQEMNERGIDPAMVNLDLNYLAPLYYPGSVTVRTTLLQLEGKKLKLQYECFSAGACVNRATSFHIWTRRGAGGMRELKSIRLDEALPEKCARLEQVLGE